MRLFKLLQQDKYHILLASLLVFFLSIAAITKDTWYTKLIISLGLAIILVAGINTLQKRSLKRLGWVVAILFVTLNIIHNIHPIPFLHLTSFLLFIGLLSFVEIGIIRMLILAKSVKPSFIIGSIAGYLLISLNLAFFILTIDGVILGHALSVPIREIGFHGILYHALITTTTVGFGDVVPAHPFVQMVSALAAVLAQFYIAVVVAVIVSKLLRRNA